ncbi:hypothetical protein TI04_03190 [Achromatium sp. WMS2]|nr:hypothetical protein TI04_03190 [Achromatium sp. WMS2]
MFSYKSFINIIALVMVVVGTLELSVTANAASNQVLGAHMVGLALSHTRSTEPLVGMKRFVGGIGRLEANNPQNTSTNPDPVIGAPENKAGNGVTLDPVAPHIVQPTEIQTFIGTSGRWSLSKPEPEVTEIPVPKVVIEPVSKAEILVSKPSIPSVPTEPVPGISVVPAPVVAEQPEPVVTVELAPAVVTVEVPKVEVESAPVLKEVVPVATDMQRPIVVAEPDTPIVVKPELPIVAEPLPLVTDAPAAIVAKPVQEVSKLPEVIAEPVVAVAELPKMPDVATEPKLEVVTVSIPSMVGETAAPAVSASSVPGVPTEPVPGVSVVPAPVVAEQPEPVVTVELAPAVVTVEVPKVEVESAPVLKEVVPVVVYEQPGGVSAIEHAPAVVDKPGPKAVAEELPVPRYAERIATGVVVLPDLHRTIAYKKPVRGRDLMTEAERMEYRLAMESAPTLDRQWQIRELAYVRLQQRARELGMALVREPGYHTAGVRWSEREQELITVDHNTLERSMKLDPVPRNGNGNNGGHHPIFMPHH